MGRSRMERKKVDQPEESASQSRVEARVPGYTAEKLVAFFRQELPKKGFTIVAQNPPRLVSYDSPITLILKTPLGTTKSVQIRTEAGGGGDVIFSVN
jgi:hypothetical protein